MTPNSVPTSLPLNPPQPNQPNYSVDMLSQFAYFKTAADYEAAFGVSATPFDPNWPPQHWFDSTVTPGGKFDMPKQYQQLGKDAQGNPALVPFWVPTSRAAKPNLPPATITDDATYQWAEQPPVPMPLVSLRANEVLVQGIMTVQVHRTDFNAPPAASQTIQVTKGQVITIEGV